MRTISHYRLEQELGRGGMGRVYKAFDLTLNRTVVLKLLGPDLVPDAASRNRFLREARLASALDHPNICTIYEISESEDQYFIAMQYIPGKTLKRTVAGRALAVEALLPLSLQIGDAIATAHSRVIVPREIKSSNIIVPRRGKAVVFDFGLAKLLRDKELTSQAELTQVGSPHGTPAYMSPEQARTERVDHRSDIFSFGVVIYEMATGQLPFKGKSNVEMMHSVINDRPVSVTGLNKRVPSQLAAVVERALAKRVSDRYQSMKEMTEGLREVLISLRGTSASFAPAARRRGLFGFLRRVATGREKREPSWETQS